ncbi:MAG: DUF3108 domain-containing protein [Deltaproteobacteria bacterium]|nr:DUF3108 domain-containing protein [Deltaproteobacteria bacterium]
MSFFFISTAFASSNEIDESDSFLDQLTGQGNAGYTKISNKNILLQKPSAPRTPKDLPPCRKPIVITRTLPKNVGETIRYTLNVNGLSVGTIDFRIEKRGAANGRIITEYRSLFKITEVVASLLPVEGRAAALVADETYWPIQAMNNYKISRNEFSEKQQFSADGHSARSHRIRNGKASDEQQSFPGAVQDFVSGFYFMRSLPQEADGCAILYGNQRAYTAWVKYIATEQIKTPVGIRPSYRYDVKFASNKAQRAAMGRLWLSTGEERLPYKAELLTGTHLVGDIYLYETGKP